MQEDSCLLHFALEEPGNRCEKTWGHTRVAIIGHRIGPLFEATY